MKKTTMFAGLALVGALVAGGMLTTSASAEPNGLSKKHDEKKIAKEGAVKIGDAAPAFELKDLDDKAVKLSDYKGKVVVLEWFNPACPFILKHHKFNTTFNDLNQEYSSKNVVFLAINSSAKGQEGNGKDLNVKSKTEFKLPYPVLIDEDGRVGKAYGAKTTPHCFIIDKDGNLVYRGAIDNNNSPKTLGTKNYVKSALDEILAGKKVSESDTQPYGCGVKYAK